MATQGRRTNIYRIIFTLVFYQQLLRVREMNRDFDRTIGKLSSATAMQAHIVTLFFSQTIANKQSAVTMGEISYTSDWVWRGIGDELGYLPSVIVKCQTTPFSLPRFTSGAVDVTLPVIAGPMLTELPLDFIKLFTVVRFFFCILLLFLML